MIKFAVEQYRDAIEEVKPYYALHYAELASNKEIDLNPNYDAYNGLADAGLIHLVTARDNGLLVGYHISIVSPHMHYQHSLTAFTDIYYLDEKYRIGRNGINMFKFMESSLKKRGVERIYMMTKTDSDKSKILKRLGYAEKERIYTKMI